MVISEIRYKYTHYFVKLQQNEPKINYNRKKERKSFDFLSFVIPAGFKPTTF